MMSIKKRVGGLAAAAIIVLLAGCSGSGSGAGGASSESGGVAVPAPARDATGAADGETDGGTAARSAAEPNTFAAKTGGSDTAKSAATSALPSGAQVVRTAGQTVRVGDVRAAAARARTATIALGGYVAAENLYLGNTPDLEPADDGSASTLTLRVPQKSTDIALDRLAAIGKELNRTTTADDVTAQVADLTSRVETQERSVKRVRDLLDRAKSLKDVVLLESELSRREGDLEAAQARYRALADQATLATINLELVSQSSLLPPTQDDGFLHGLRRGWDALGRSTVAVVTAVGAVLPFAVLLGVIGVPVYLLIRRRRQPSTVQPSSVPTAPAAADSGPDQP